MPYLILAPITGLPPAFWGASLSLTATVLNLARLPVLLLPASPDPATPQDMRSEVSCCVHCRGPETSRMEARAWSTRSGLELRVNSNRSALPAAAC